MQHYVYFDAEMAIYYCLQNRVITANNNQSELPQIYITLQQQLGIQNVKELKLVTMHQLLS